MGKRIHFKGEMKVLDVTDFDCPNCDMPHDLSDYEGELNDQGRAVIECMNCDSSLGVDISGEKPVVWEIKNN